MPRVYTSQSDPIDFCKEHFPDEDFAYYLFGELGDGPDGRGNCFGWDAEHPDYDGDFYYCYNCEKELTGEDN